MNTEDRELHKRKSHLFMLLMLAEADNEDSPLEVLFINKVAERLGMTPEDVQEIDKNPENLTLVIPKTEHARMEILYDLLFLMKFDQDVDQSEIDLVHRLAFRMGFRPTMTQEMIDVMKQHIGRNVPKDSLLNIIRKYMN